MEELFEKYKNIQLFALKYRNFTDVNPKFLEFEEFKNKIQTNGYIQHNFNNPRTNSPIDIYLFKVDSKFITSTINFKKILEKYDSKTKHDIIMITKEELNVYRRKSVRQYKNLNVKNYLHKHFIIELNKGPLCSKHTLLSKNEVKTLCYDLMAHGHKLPAIFADDPQCIWVGGEINDIIKIEAKSEITGKTIRYRIVTPSSGKVIQATYKPVPNEEIKTKPNEETKEKNNIEVNDEIQEEEIEDDEDFVDDYED